MNKYFLIRPNEFWKYDDVDVNGEYPHIKVDNFKVSDNKELNSMYNYFMIEVPYKRNKIGDQVIRFSSVGKEIFTGSKFYVEVVYHQELNENQVSLFSEELGLYLIHPIPLKEVITKNSKVSGLINYLKENDELFESYCKNLDNTIEASRFYKQRHDDTMEGLSRSTKRELRKGFFRHIR